ncbi:hypothetical protein [uncultured Tateyamaria sp.]|uniref:hypothetical protein n=1 Tax=uncultured Tateyamaria sp. TaxID=455651 RepID=UPI002617483C|nr:hypothetical protein [uncultured Tateyamaria sp.]
MTPRDLTDKTVLIVGDEMVEVMDISEHLTVSGWAEPVVASSAREAIAVLIDRVTPFSLAVVTVAHANPEVAGIIRTCVDEGCPVIIVNGARATVRKGQVVMLSRPYITSDIDQALVSLGLVTT